MAQNAQKKDKRPAPISWRPTDAEREEFFKRVENSGLSANRYISHACLGRPIPRQISKIDQKLLRQILGELGKIGGNVNQIAHAAHLDKYMSASHEAALNDLIEMRTALMEALGKRP